MPNPITGYELYNALKAAGIFVQDDNVRRFVIDSGEPNRPVIIYVERYGDERLLRVAQTLEGVEIRGVPAT